MIRRLVEGLNQPAYVTGRRWDVLAWNSAADEIFAFSRLAEEDRNTLISVLTNPHTRGLFGSAWADEAKRMVAQFRATHDLWAGDPAFIDLLERLRQGCPEFAPWWEAHDIGSITAGRKRLSHPKKGSLRFEYATFQANDDPALKRPDAKPGARVPVNSRCCAKCSGYPIRASMIMCNRKGHAARRGS